MAHVPHEKYLAKAVEGEPPVQFRNSDNELVRGRFVGRAAVKATRIPGTGDKPGTEPKFTLEYPVLPDGEVIILTHANRHEFDLAARSGHITLEPVKE